MKPDGSIGSAGKGPLIQVEKSATLGTSQDQTLFVLNDQGGSVLNISVDKTNTLRAQDHGHPPIIFGISPYASNAMKSDNPHSGIYEAETSRTLDLNGGNPACNQGGMIVLAAIEGNGSRPSHKGTGINDGEVMYTLNGTEIHGVVTFEPGILKREGGQIWISSKNSYMTEWVQDKAPTLVATDWKDPQIIIISHGD